MDQIECLRHAILRRLREQQPPLLPGQAIVTQLACMLDVGQPAHHLFQLTERVEAKMAIAGVAQPWLLRVLRREADRLLHL